VFASRKSQSICCRRPTTSAFAGSSRTTDRCAGGGCPDFANATTFATSFESKTLQPFRSREGSATSLCRSHRNNVSRWMPALAATSAVESIFSEKATIDLHILAYRQQRQEKYCSFEQTAICACCRAIVA